MKDDDAREKELQDHHVFGVCQNCGGELFKYVGHVCEPAGVHPQRENPEAGRKDDKGKPMWSRLPFNAVNEIVRVLDYGAKKYTLDNWMHVKDFDNRYLSAAFRHLAAWGDGENNDEESDLPHLAHAGCCILFLLWSECSKRK